MLPTLRKVLQKQVNPAIDRDAFKVVREVDLEENAWTETNLREDDLTEPQRERFYFNQAREWAKLIELAANQLREIPKEKKFLIEYNRIPAEVLQEPALIEAARAAGMDKVPHRQRLGEWSKKYDTDYVKRGRGRKGKRPGRTKDA